MLITRAVIACLLVLSSSSVVNGLTHDAVTRTTSGLAQRMRETNMPTARSGISNVPQAAAGRKVANAADDDFAGVPRPRPTESAGKPRPKPLGGLSIPARKPASETPSVPRPFPQAGLKPRPKPLGGFTMSKRVPAGETPSVPRPFPGSNSNVPQAAQDDGQKPSVPRPFPGSTTNGGEKKPLPRPFGVPVSNPGASTTSDDERPTVPRPRPSQGKPLKPTAGQRRQAADTIRRRLRAGGNTAQAADGEPMTAVMGAPDKESEERALGAVDSLKARMADIMKTLATADTTAKNDSVVAEASKPVIRMVEKNGAMVLANDTEVAVQKLTDQTTLAQQDPEDPAQAAVLQAARAASAEKTRLDNMQKLAAAGAGNATATTDMSAMKTNSTDPLVGDRQSQAKAAQDAALASGPVRLSNLMNRAEDT